jgi:hypothetical protein
MMDLQEVEVVINKDGEVRLLVHGVKGNACLDLTRDLEAALGGLVTSRQMTSEAMETIQQDPLLRQNQQRT